MTLSLPRCVTSGHPEKKASVTGILFVLKHWTSKHYCVSVCFVDLYSISFLLTQTIHTFISVQPSRSSPFGIMQKCCLVHFILFYIDTIGTCECNLSSKHISVFIEHFTCY